MTSDPPPADTDDLSELERIRRTERSSLRRVAAAHGIERSSVGAVYAM